VTQTHQTRGGFQPSGPNPTYLLESSCRPGSTQRQAQQNIEAFAQLLRVVWYPATRLKFNAELRYWQRVRDLGVSHEFFTVVRPAHRIAA